jgi:hypothetical protein
VPGRRFDATGALVISGTGIQDRHPLYREISDETLVVRKHFLHQIADRQEPDQTPAFQHWQMTHALVSHER